MPKVLVRCSDIARQPERVSFNFLAKCNMSCPYCYCPFDNREAGLDLWVRIIDKVKSWTTVSVTFGGGDPFLYKDFPQLLVYTASDPNPLEFIQVDTNGIGLHPRHDQIFQDTVGLLGLPLDGSNSKIHGLMRSNFKHFQIVVSLIERLGSLVPIKVNTVVSNVNANDLEKILDLLSSFSVRTWSLYEYWPMGLNAATHNQVYALAHNDFMEKAHRIKEMCDFAEIEIGSIASRSQAYFFVSQTGRAYAIHSTNVNEYVELGSIFDDDVLERWNLHADLSQMSNRLTSRMVDR